jgi:hypothetical protein
MRHHTYTTANGAEVTIQIVTERENLADHNVTNKGLWELEVHAKGHLLHPRGVVESEDHPHGLLDCGTMRIGNKAQHVYIPMDETARAIYDEYRVEARRRMDAAIQADEQDARRRERVLQAMDHYGDAKANR